ncbi:hypothetical protein RR42_s0967 [Cupriavidus basilensis]|uniref:Uncharacterized protein n=1 Tax=Cupriavidus basilensis TaxID=68895 RepID=A0A0C4YAN0_9BURK|nr:hypothetical protein RR42_s0967 [Cupriavidus basilensis]
MNASLPDNKNNAISNVFPFRQEEGPMLKTGVLRDGKKI